MRHLDFLGCRFEPREVVAQAKVEVAECGEVCFSAVRAVKQKMPEPKVVTGVKVGGERRLARG